MTKAQPRIALSQSRDIPFDKLVLSQSNVRRVKAGVDIEQLADDIERRTLLQSLFAFAPGVTFAFVRWSANDYGTVVSRIDVMRGATEGARVVHVPGVVPGGESLLRIAGWPRVQKVLLAIDQIEALGLQPETICPDHWRHVHSRLIAGLRHRDYTLERHRAWRMRERIAV